MRRRLPSSAGARWLLALVAFFVVANLAALLTSTVRPEPSGRPGSAYATQPLGAAAYAELLRRYGHPVSHLREPLAGARLDPSSTVVVLAPDRIAAGDRAALARFVRAGGRLVAAGTNPGHWLGGALARPPRWTGPVGQRSFLPTAPVPETSGVASVATSGAGAFAAPGDALPVLGDDPALLVVASAGAGRALLLADASPLQNRLLARADNAALALALAGPARRPVTFVESVHGLQRTGLGALPARWRFALAGIVLAGLLWLLARARRLGPVERIDAQPPPARREHVEALALALRRARDPHALDALQATARAQVLRRASLADDASGATVREAALGLGFDTDEADALLDDSGARDPLAVGRALVKGRR